MLFSSFGFIFGFLPVTLGGFLFFRHCNAMQAAKLWLIAASTVFYGNFIPVHLLVLGLSTLANFSLGRLLLRRRSAVILASGVALNLGVLTVFKYADFIVGNINVLLGTSLPLAGFILPLALSFFTFQKIAYLVDVYRGGAPRYSFGDFVLFVVYFPQLIAGPIVHHRDIMPQIAAMGQRRDVATDLTVGSTAFVIGLFKKLAIADSLSVYSDSVFGAATGGATPDLLSAWVGVLSFTLQIYFDFSGYSDMALGLSRMFGIRLPVNFLSPYKATSIIDFWRRWHITLSEFLRLYLYVPLGGNRRGLWRRYRNLWIVMLLGGLWHGAGWTFVVWGGLHAFYLSVNHTARSLGWPRFSGPAGRLAAWLVTMLAVMVAWVFFRAPDGATALRMLAGMAGQGGIILPSAAAALNALAPVRLDVLGVSFGGLHMLDVTARSQLLWLPAGLVICLCAPNVADWLRGWNLSLRRDTESGLSAWWLRWQPTLLWGVAISLLLAFCVTYQQNTAPFLYFQF
ncbi:MBOAT family O-acyltransferase [Ferrovibrio terrae]|uniref:MBOAT family O-acyltransferase n=1 Tax=Ferrovibrio terrae TaxID=2594003 RepID=UPI003138087B